MRWPAYRMWKPFADRAHWEAPRGISAISFAVDCVVVALALCHALPRPLFARPLKSQSSDFVKDFWRALRESNPCFRRERAASWTARRRARTTRKRRCGEGATYKEVSRLRQGARRGRLFRRTGAKSDRGKLGVPDRKDGSQASLAPAFVQSNMSAARNPRAPAHQCPVLGIEVHGSLGGSAAPFCSSSMDCLSGERTNAIMPSRGGRLIVTPAFISFSQVA
jgi:hypothetical protein